MTITPKIATYCSKCNEPAARRQGSSQSFCAKHYRFGQMRATAKRTGKSVPDYKHLEVMPGSDLDCPDCHVRMNWLAIDGQATVASLQHYRNGTFAIVCRSCNTRHAFMAGDTFRQLPRDHKQCGRCKRILGPDEYRPDRTKSGRFARRTECKDCARELSREYRARNRDKYNAWQKAWRDKKKETP